MTWSTDQQALGRPLFLRFFWNGRVCRRGEGRPGVVKDREARQRGSLRSEAKGRKVAEGSSWLRHYPEVGGDREPWTARDCILIYEKTIPLRGRRI